MQLRVLSVLFVVADWPAPIPSFQYSSTTLSLDQDGQTGAKPVLGTQTTSCGRRVLLLAMRIRIFCGYTSVCIVRVVLQQGLLTAYFGDSGFHSAAQGLASGVRGPGPGQNLGAIAESPRQQRSGFRFCP